MNDFANDKDTLINRQAAIDEINKYILSFDAIDANFLDGLKTSIKLIKENVPSAQRKGKWIRNNDSDHAWKCSVCGCGYTDYILTYCYDCGAKMERGEDE